MLKIVKLVDQTDQYVRNASLNVCATIYKHVDAQFWDLIGKKISTKGIDLIKARLNQHGIQFEEKKPAQKTARNMKSPIGRNTSKLNSSLRGNDLGRSKIQTTKTPRKQGFGFKSTIAKEPSPEPVEPEPVEPEPAEEVEDIDMPDDRPEVTT